MFPNSALAYRSRFVSILQTLIIVAGLTVSLPFGQAWAQATNTGTVSGQITDQQGAAIAGTELKLIDTSTGVTRTTISNDTGRYTFVNVDPGVYD
ncbi:MAG: carboxypeptidase regulatory-like domain-containing protein, partial [Acidobacteriaceae bacterium]|nr:carboxypeptidase regulatory-like domain-containing protein [Acidobacteriaceae bacterium]